MKKLLLLFLALIIIAAIVYNNRLGQEVAVPGREDSPAQASISEQDVLPERAVLDISVHSLDEMRIVLERAEVVAARSGKHWSEASIVLVLHGPEVEYFSTRNYGQYKDIVDQAARLDALDIVDVKICQTMMAIRGIARDDIPPFIEQVPNGEVEVERLVGEGYVYF